ncbi:hypothetical protein [Roseisolibacter sp. H3M3-2]|uniref:hypothetical protein n=1 Tax=Roseisolibacter sp. H3M3-2 TaxID=3031323 RepID=UPI0023DAB540|nr:hypothetical protein [Roseisolibacter sp. H3M3-2]MDF1503973.1 hypothetical protein [Roseisolibacter sp. H3M3-2]
MPVVVVAAQPALRPRPAAADDGARVRAHDPATRRTRTGQALGWGGAAPRLVTTRGDTAALDTTLALSRSMGRTGRRTVPGILLGWAVGVGVTVADCGWKATCGEQNPLPLLGAAAGGLVGARFRREVWRPVASVGAACAPAAATPPPP